MVDKFLFLSVFSIPIQPGTSILIWLCRRNDQQHWRCDETVDGDKDTIACFDNSPLRMQVLNVFEQHRALHQEQEPRFLEKSRLIETSTRSRKTRVTVHHER